MVNGGLFPGMAVWATLESDGFFVGVVNVRGPENRRKTMPGMEGWEIE